jgi:hypothetical protein
VSPSARGSGLGAVGPIGEDAPVNAPVPTSSSLLTTSDLFAKDRKGSVSNGIKFDSVFVGAAGGTDANRAGSTDANRAANPGVDGHARTQSAAASLGRASNVARKESGSGTRRRVSIETGGLDGAQESVNPMIRRKTGEA